MIGALGRDGDSSAGAAAALIAGACACLCVCNVKSSTYKSFPRRLSYGTPNKREEVVFIRTILGVLTVRSVKEYEFSVFSGGFVLLFGCLFFPGRTTSTLSEEVRTPLHRFRSCR